MGIILGLIGVVVGSLMIIKTESLVQAFGHIEWAERKLGPGQTRLFHKLLGLVIIFISFLAMTGLLEGFLVSILSFVFPGLQK